MSTLVQRSCTLTVSMLTNWSLVIQTKYRKRALCDKILVPFGAPPDQTIHLLKLTARDVYGIHFNKLEAFSSDEQESGRPGEPGKAEKILLESIWDRHFELSALLCLNRSHSN